MSPSLTPPLPPTPLGFRGGTLGALLPLLLVVGGVSALGLAGAPDERGFWPVLLTALGLGTALAVRPGAYAEQVLRGMSQPIVALLILAWMLAGVLATTLTAGGFVDALVAATRALGLGGGTFCAAAFLLTAAVSTATGTSLGTLILCVPVLYPAGVLQAADPTILAGALLGGATFGDNVSPVSDTTIASATSQSAEIGPVVRSRLKYALPAAALALLGAGLLGSAPSPMTDSAPPDGTVSLAPLALGLGPATAFVLLLRRSALVPALLAAAAVAIAVGLLLGLLTPGALLQVDRDAYAATGILRDGMERAVGLSVFTLLLMGLVQGFLASGTLDRWLAGWVDSAGGVVREEARLVGATSAAVLLTTHSVVALLAVGPLGQAMAGQVPPERRANLMDLTVCVWPFLLPVYIPTLLAASLTGSASGDVPGVSALHVGMANLHSWGLLLMLVLAVAAGYGRERPGIGGMEPGIP